MKKSSGLDVISLGALLLQVPAFPGAVSWDRMALLREMIEECCLTFS